MGTSTGTRARWLGGLSRREWLGRGGVGAALAGFFGDRRPLRAAPAAVQAPVPNVYASLGVRPIVNARGTITVLGGSRMSSDVRRAMDAATDQYVHIDELAEAVGRRLGALTGAEWGIVTSGCSAALTLATAASVAGADPDKLAQLPDLSRLPNEVVVPAYSRSPYDHALRAVGTRIVEVRTREEFESALGPRTAMIMVLAGPEADAGPLNLRDICRAAGPRGIPVLVDAAAEELRVPNVHLARGASLVAYSGGKCLRGPQCAGVLLGQADLVRAAWMHSAPHHGFGRALKVGREEIIGMLTAVELWMRRDHDGEQREWLSWLRHITERLAGIRGVRLVLTLASDALSNRSSTLTVAWDPNIIPLKGYEVEDLLYDGDPRIAVGGAGSFLPFPPNEKSEITLIPYQMRPGEEQIVADRLRAFFSNPPRSSRVESGAAAQITGTWNVTIAFTRGEARHVFTIEQRGSQLTGIHAGEFAQRQIQGSVEGSNVLIRTSHTQQGVRLNFEFSGTVAGAAMSGDLSLGEYGRARWSATRI